MRIAALGDLHFSPQSYDRIREAMNRLRDEADLLILAGDITNLGKPEEMESMLATFMRLRVPIVAVLGNHDFECGRHEELAKMMAAEGVKVLDGSGYERDGVGFAGTKGFIGGFGRGVLTAFGEPEVKAFVQSAINETLKLERALSMLRTEKRIVVTHYSPVVDTVRGEPEQIFPYLGSSRLAEVIDRHQAVLAIHGHAHHGALEGKTTGGVPVYNVALPLLMARTPAAPYRLFDL
ncbi:MAG: metallophosphoesterase [Acidobacteria bacterium]|nr:MAG: metallophosphoesterase [Acidobacteriota bacterium]PYY21343.1 MAG: metallophosphoesterase [Acidobacteriota bacterium]